MKIQMYKVAKEFGVTVAELVRRLEARGIKKKTHSFESLTDEEYKITRALFAPGKAAPQKMRSTTPPSILQPEPEPTASSRPPARKKPAEPKVAPKSGQSQPAPAMRKIETLKAQPSTPLSELEGKVRAAPVLKPTPTTVALTPRPEPKITPQVIVKPTPPVVERPKAPRPPVVTILGHVDHGKTTLLDYIRKTRVAAGEAGGITQSIGAYQAEYKNKRITFIDTPGHKAFANMRARGAQITDIIVLVVAADDGVMEQTREAISHARAAQVPIIVAVNKIDKPTASAQRVQEQLAREGLTPEDWGGDTIVVSLSALSGQGVDELLEMILLVAELQELKADPQAMPSGVIVESSRDASRGPIATVIVQEGTLRERDIILCKTTYGRIRALLDDRGHRVSEAPPGSAVQVMGLSDIPGAGERFESLMDLMEAKRRAEDSLEELRRTRLERTRRSIQDILQQQIKKGLLRVILKGDSAGGLEAVENELRNLKVEHTQLEFLHTGIGNINESDVLLASVVKDAVIIGFRAEIDGKAARIAEQENIPIRTYEIIYQVTDDVKRALQGLVEPQIREAKVGEAEVRHIFKIPNVGVVAGCYVRDGQVLREARVRVKRAGAVVFDGALASLKHFEQDVKRVEKDKECGIKIAGFDKVQIGDVFEFYTREVVPRI